MKGKLKEIEVAVPDWLDNDEATFWLALGLLEHGKVSLGKAAEMCRLSVRTFWELANQKGSKVVWTDKENLASDIINA